MTVLSGFPGWMLLIFAFMFIGPAMRMIFGRRSHYTGIVGEREFLGKKGRINRSDMARLEEAIGQRDQVIEDLQQRLSEIESRLDFTERMIATRNADQARENTIVGG